MRQQRRRTAAVQQQGRHGAEQARGGRQAAVDQAKGGTVAARHQRIVGITGELGIGAARGRQVRGPLVQDLAHQRGRRRDAAATVQAVAIEQVDGQRGPDAGQQHRLTGQPGMRGQQREKTIHAEPRRFGISDGHTGQ